MRKSVEQVIDDCQIQKSYEMATKGEALALSVAIPKALVENDYSIDVLDDTVWQDFTEILEHEIAHCGFTSPRIVAADIIVKFQNAGLLVRRRA